MFDAESSIRGTAQTCSGSSVINDGNGTITSTWNYVPTSCVGVTYNTSRVIVDHAYRGTLTYVGLTKFYPKLAPCKDANGDDCFPCTGNFTSGGIDTASGLLTQLL